ncbi:hypothetical protein D3Z55_01360 [Clostridiaceae bacterium]|nr:hypothetical protein [Clostridiaceae bacterium]
MEAKVKGIKRHPSLNKKKYDRIVIKEKPALRNEGKIMLRFIAEKCTDVLLKQGVIEAAKKPIYIYGFELFWSTFSAILSILFLGICFGYWKHAVVFLLCFVPIRTTAGGYHAKTYGTCFFLTNFTAVVCVLVSCWLWIWRSWWVEGILWLAGMISFLYIWRNAPVQSEKHSLKPENVIKNRGYSHRILGMEMAVFLLVRLLWDHYVTYTAIVATCGVAVMIVLAERR